MVMERDLLKLMPSQDTTEEDMEVMVMVDMAVDTVMERGRLMPSQDTAVDMDMVVMVDMDVDTVMERGRLMPSQDTLEEDMAVMVVMAMEDMVIAVKFFPLFIVPPPIDFLLV